MNQPIFSLMYQGEKTPVFLNERSSSFYKSSEGFVTPSPKLERLEFYYDNWCKKELKPIVQGHIEALRYKKVSAEIEYSQVNGKKFLKKEYWSVNDALDAYDFDRHIFVEIGASNKEWGINKVQKGKKFFTLFFNINLIKLGANDRIKHVVAHELAHVFVRDHSYRFDRVLDQLDGNSFSNKTYWNGGFASKNTFSIIFALLLVCGVLYVLYALFGPLLENFIPKAQTF